MLCVDLSVCVKSLETRIQLIGQRFLGCLKPENFSQYSDSKGELNREDSHINAVAFITSYFSQKMSSSSSLSNGCAPGAASESRCKNARPSSLAFGCPTGPSYSDFPPSALPFVT